MYYKDTTIVDNAHWDNINGFTKHIIIHLNTFKYLIHFNKKKK